ncbi:MAG: copper transporter [Georgenia sp.]
MIDFRYHIVSLIAVFLALAVGIVLGAGPLNSTIGDSLTGQVDDLRADRERLRGDLEGAVADVTERTTYIESAAPVLLADRLTDRGVMVVTLPGADPGDVESVRNDLATAGARLTGEVAVTEAWTDPDSRAFRQSFAGQLLGYLDPQPAQDVDVETIFGLALGHALTDAAVAEPGQEPAGDTLSTDAVTLLDLLTSANVPLVTVTSELTGPADATVLVGPRPAEAPAETTPAEEVDALREVLAAHVRLAAALGEVAPAVTVGAAVTDLDLVEAVRADDAASATVTTVDSVGEVTATISTPLAVAVSISGARGHYGFQSGAEDPMPPRVDLTPVSQEPPVGGADAPPDGTATPTDGTTPPADGTA